MDMKNRPVVFSRNHDCPLFPEKKKKKRKKENHRLTYLTPVFCPIQILHYCNTALQNISSETDSKEYRHNFSKLTT